MTPGSLVGGIGPIDATRRPEFASARTGTREENAAVLRAQVRRAGREASARRADLGLEPGWTGVLLDCPHCGNPLMTWLGQVEGDLTPNLPHGECGDCEWIY